MSSGLLSPVAGKLTATSTPTTTTLEKAAGMLILTNLDASDKITVNINDDDVTNSEGIVLSPGVPVSVNYAKNGGVIKKFSSSCIAGDAAVATTTPGVAAVAEVQTITVDATGGTFTITWSGQTTSALAYNVSAADMETALDALSNIADGDVEVTGGPGDAGGTTPYVLTWLSSLGNVAAPTTDAASLTGGAGTATVATTTPGVAAVAEVQTVTFTAISGTFTLTWSGQTTSALAYNVSAADMETALDALSNIADGDVEVTGSAGAYTLTWLSSLGNVAAPTINTSGLELNGSAVLAYMAL